jgi:penicillin-binding protein 2
MNLFHLLSTHRARKAASHEIDPEDVFLDSQNLSQFNVDQMEGHLEKPISKHVFYLVVVGVCVIIASFSYRLFSMQIIQGEIYAEKAENNHLKKIPLFALRGTISDRNGELLAWNSLTYGSSTNNETNFNDIPKRVYTETKGFSHLLGYVSYPKKDQSGIFWQDEYIGKDGVEKQYHSLLSGVRGERIVEITARQEIEAQNVVVYPTNGENLVLTVDASVQAKLYESIASLAKKAGFMAGAGVIVDVHSGEILAITSYPEYDNNLITNAVSKEEKSKVGEQLLDEDKRFLDRAVSGLFTPGSTVKPFFAYAALAEDVIDEHASIYSSGKLVIKNKYGGPDSVFRDWRAHGYVNMREAIAQSSDEYFYQIGGGYQDQKGLGIVRLEQYSNMFGFGSVTGIDLPDEEHGVIPSPEWKQKVFEEDWLLGNTYHSSIGQYGFQLTPLELVRAVASVANNGYLITPHVLKRLETASSSINLDQKKLKVIKDGMRMAVTSEAGTAKTLRFDEVEVSAKSGTAETGAYKQYVNSLMIGYFPSKAPKYAFVVVMEKASKSNTFGAGLVMKDVIRFMLDETKYIVSDGKE